MRRFEKAILLIVVALLLIALVHRLYTRGGPYLQLPLTIVDHVGPNQHVTRDALVLLPRIRPLLPRGATVACFQPTGDQPSDVFNFLTAVGQLPAQTVLPRMSANLDIPRQALVEYVVAIRQPFTHPAYRAIAEFPEGRLYKVIR